MVAMKGVIEETTPLFLAGVRLLPAGILVLIVTAMQKRSQPQGWKAWLWIVLGQTLSLENLNPQREVLTSYLYFVVLFFGEKTLRMVE